MLCLLGFLPRRDNEYNELIPAAPQAKHAAKAAFSVLRLTLHAPHESGRSKTKIILFYLSFFSFV